MRRWRQDQVGSALVALVLHPLRCLVLRIDAPVGRDRLPDLALVVREVALLVGADVAGAALLPGAPVDLFALSCHLLRPPSIVSLSGWTHDRCHARPPVTRNADSGMPAT